MEWRRSLAQRMVPEGGEVEERGLKGGKREGRKKKEKKEKKEEKGNLLKWLCEEGYLLDHS